MWFDLWQPQFCGHEMQGTGAAQGPPQPSATPARAYHPPRLWQERKTPQVGRKGQSTLRKPGPPLAKWRVRDWLTPSTTLGFRLLFLSAGGFTFTSFRLVSLALLFLTVKLSSSSLPLKSEPSSESSPETDHTSAHLAGRCGASPSATFCTHIPVPFRVAVPGAEQGTVPRVRPGPPHLRVLDLRQAPDATVPVSHAWGGENPTASTTGLLCRLS